MATLSRGTLADLAASGIRDIPDFPSPGVVFKDITPVLADPTAFAGVVDHMAQLARQWDATVIAGMEARGFILAAPVALSAGLGFVPLRKPGKLPAATLGQSYDLEYGQDELQVHADAIRPGARVLVVDDVLATGGTAGAACALMEKAGAEVAGLAFLLELSFLGGRNHLTGRRMDALVVS